MTGPIRQKLSYWLDESKGAKTRLNSDLGDPVSEREDVSQSNLSTKIDRGDRVQKARLKFYPSIEIDFKSLYAGSINGGLRQAEKKLYDMGFRNGPLAYVEITDEYGPDDGSYWKQKITETGKFPFIDNRISAFRRVKDQIHTCIFVDEGDNMVHFTAHREQSSLLQPARHLYVGEGEGYRGVRGFRAVWYDTFGEALPAPLGLDYDIEVEPQQEVELRDDIEDEV